MHMQFSTYMENTWAIKKAYHTPLRRTLTPVERFLWQQYTILCILYFSDSRDQIIIYIYFILYIYNKRIVTCPWTMLHNESSIQDQ